MKMWWSIRSFICRVRSDRSDRYVRLHFIHWMSPNWSTRLKPYVVFLSPWCSCKQFAIASLPLVPYWIDFIHRIPHASVRQTPCQRWFCWLLCVWLCTSLWALICSISWNKSHKLTKLSNVHVPDFDHLLHSHVICSNVMPSAVRYALLWFLNMWGLRL